MKFRSDFPSIQTAISACTEAVRPKSTAEMASSWIRNQ